MGLVSYLLGKEDASTGAIAALLALVGIVLPALLGTALRVLHTQIIAVRCIPQPPLAGWLSGHLRLLARNDYYRQVLAWANELGPVFRFRIFFRTNIVVSDPVLVQQILGSGPEGVPMRSADYQIVDMIYTKGQRGKLLSMLGTRDEAEWFHMRRSVQSAFSPACIRHYYKAVKRHGDMLMHTLSRKAGAPEGIVSTPALVLFTARAMVEALFDMDPDSLDLQQFIVDIDATYSELHGQMRNPLRTLKFTLFPGCQAAKKFLTQKQRVMDLLAAVSEHILAHDEPDNPQAACLMWACFKRLTTPKGQPYTALELAPEAGLMMYASLGTTAASINWVLFAAAAYPEWQEKVAEEARAAGLGPAAGGSDDEPPLVGMPSLDNLSKLRLLEALLNETARMYPIFATVPVRETHKPTQIGDYLIPAGVTVWPLIYVMHNSAHNWEQPETFLPERWLVPGTALARTTGCSAAACSSKSDSSGSAAQDAYCPEPRRFMPFGEGHKNCVGQALGAVVLKATVAALLANFRVSLHPDMGGPEGALSKVQVAIYNKLPDLKLVLERRA